MGLGLDLGTLDQLLLAAIGALSTCIVALFWYHAKEQRRNMAALRERDKISLENQRKSTEVLTEIRVVLNERLPRGQR